MGLIILFNCGGAVSRVSATQRFKQDCKEKGCFIIHYICCIKSVFMNNVNTTAVFEPCEEGGFIAYIQEISGINIQGETIAEAKENLTDAVNLMFEELRSKS